MYNKDYNKMVNKPKVVAKIDEDGSSFETLSGKTIVRVNRDDDSFISAIKVFEALNIEVIDEE